MAKRKQAREKRRAKNKQSQQRKQLVIGAVGVIVVVAALLLAAQSSGGGIGGVAYNERFDLDPILGNVDAPVTIIEYGAYACPSCKYWHEQGTIEQILAEFPEQVRFIFRDFPVISPAYDRMTAELAQCVLDQGNDTFWVYHDILYTIARQGAEPLDRLLDFAAQAGADRDEIRACYDSGTHRDTVGWDNKRGQDLGLRGTPSFFVNDQPIFSLSLDTLRTEINRALRS